MRRGDALAAPEPQEHREDVAEKGGEAGHGDADGVGAERAGQQTGQPALGGVAEQRQQRGQLVAGAQDVGGAGIAGAVAARIGEAEGLRNDDGEGQRTEQVTERGEESAFMRVGLECAAF